MYAHLHVCGCMCTCLCMHVNVCLWVNVHVCVSACVCWYMYMTVWTKVYVHIYVGEHSCMCKCIVSGTCICVCAYTCVLQVHLCVHACGDQGWCQKSLSTGNSCQWVWGGGHVLALAVIIVQPRDVQGTTKMHMSQRWISQFVAVSH